MRTGRGLRRAVGSRAGGMARGNVVGRRRPSRYSDFAVLRALRKDSAPVKQSGLIKSGPTETGAIKTVGRGILHRND